MITPSTIKTQIARLMRLPFVPRDPEDMKALADEYKRVLTERCRDDQHAIKTVTSVMDTPREQLVTPGDIVAAATGTNTEQPPQGFPGCEQCGYSGWILCKRGKYGQYDCSIPCSCRTAPATVSPFELDRRKRLKRLGADS